MGEEREGPDATPRLQEEPYLERPKPARRWTRHLENRSLHPRNRMIVTPAGTFASASQAADAHGFTRGHAAYLAGAGLRGWRWWDGKVDAGEIVPVRGRSRRPPPPHAKRVFTPDGIYDSATLAGLAHGISRAAAAKRASTGLHGWGYEPKPEKGIGLEVNQN